MVSRLQIKKGVFGGYSVGYDCPHCASRLKSPIDEAGTTDSCPNCGRSFIVPGQEERDQIRSRQELEEIERQDEKRHSDKRRRVQLAVDDFRAKLVAEPRPHRKTRAERKQNEKVVAAIIAGVFMVFLLFCFTAIGNWLSNNSRENSNYASPSNEKPVPRGGEADFATEGSVLRSEAVGATNEAVYDRMIKLNIAGDRTGFAALMDEGLVFLLDSGTRVRVIDRGILKTEIKVESGLYSGRYLIVDATSIDK